MHNILKWLQFKQYAISHKLLAKMGRRLRAGHRLLEPVVGVRVLPPQVRNGDMETWRFREHETGEMEIRECQIRVHRLISV